MKELAGYVANGSSNLKKYGASIAYEGSTLRMTSTKYTTIYPFNSSVDNIGITENSTNLNIASANNYKENKLIYGDGIRETSTEGTESTSWYGDFSRYSGLYTPFLLCSGGFWGGSSSGLFSFSRADGNSGFNNGFRAVLIVY